jgi:hypothetical protein
MCYGCSKARADLAARLIAAVEMYGRRILVVDVDDILDLIRKEAEG